MLRGKTVLNEPVSRGSNQLPPQAPGSGKAPPRNIPRPHANGEGDYMSEFYLSEISERDKPWDIHRFEAQQVEVLYRTAGYFKYAERVHRCSEWLAFVYATGDEGEQRLRLQAARFCRVRHCPQCQWRSGMAWKARFHKALPAIAADYPTAKWILLTLTLKNVPVSELRETIAHMNKSFVRLTDLKDYPALGWIKSLEVTKEINSDGLYAHPHFHVLMMVKSTYFMGKNYINQEEWSQLWQQCLRVDYKPIVDVRSIKRRSNYYEPEDDSKSAVISGVKEVFKYTTKPSDLVNDPAWLKAITQQLHKTRVIGIGGCLRKYLSEAEVTNDEMVDTDEEQTNVLDSDPKFDAFWNRIDKRYKGNFRT